MAATPPLRAAVDTPSTPRHGAKYDNLRPHSTRKSLRQSSSRTRRAIETPPPQVDDFTNHSSDPKKRSSLRSAAHTPPSSTPTSPRKPIRKRRAQKEVGSNKVMDGHASNDPFLDPAKNLSLQQPSLNPAASMLPTPAKTPQKKPVQQAAVKAAARVLFPARPDTVEDAMPTPRKRRNKRHVGFSLYSSMEDEGDDLENQIEIYTDSKDKVPELDTSQDNPFYEQPGQGTPAPEPTKARSSRKRKASHGVAENKEVEEAFNHEEGMVYVFRGKKIFRKFPNEDAEVDSVSGSDTEAPNTVRLTRSSIKPRLLFPTARQRQEREAPNVEDEEATTEVEEPRDHEMTDHEEVSTPIRPTAHLPSTPPATGHATRASTKKLTFDSSPLDPPEPVESMHYGSRVKKVSPFDGWARTKSGTSAAGKGKKRGAESLEHGEEVNESKRVKGDQAI
ncbi:hypothetical protein P7C71_g5675, partial [Lecanoromycetidae sp. Uapishka_2]